MEHSKLQPHFYIRLLCNMSLSLSLPPSASQFIVLCGVGPSPGQECKIDTATGKCFVLATTPLPTFPTLHVPHPTRSPPYTFPCFALLYSLFDANGLWVVLRLSLRPRYLQTSYLSRQRSAGATGANAVPGTAGDVCCCRTVR